MADIIKVKLSKNTSPNYADPNDAIVYDGDQIEFSAIDADFKVTFKDSNLIMIDSETPEIYDISSGTSKLTKNFKVPPESGFYQVERTDIDDSNGRAPAKMTVKAIIKKN